MSKQVKRLMIDSIRSNVAAAQDLLVVDVSRVSAISINRIRLRLAELHIHLFCVRNSVAVIALKDLGLHAGPQVLFGPSAIVVGADDIVSLSKEVSKCAEQDKAFEIRSGISSGVVLSRSDIDVLVTSPGKVQLLSQLSQRILGVGSDLAFALTVPHGLIASQIDGVASR